MVDGGVGPAFWVRSQALDLEWFSGSSANGGVPAFDLVGTVSTSSTWQAQPVPWLVAASSCGEVDVPAGVTVTMQPGTVAKGTTSNCGYAAALSVEGTLVADSGLQCAPNALNKYTYGSLGTGPKEGYEPLITTYYISGCQVGRRWDGGSDHHQRTAIPVSAGISNGSPCSVS